MKQLILVATIMVGLMLAGCKKDLDINNPNTPTTAVYWKTASDAQKGVNSIYSTFHRPGLCRWLFFITMIRADEGFSTSPNPDLVNNFDAFLVTNYDYYETRSLWQDDYVGIFRANQVLDNVPSIAMDATQQKQLIAEAKFLRAFFYYNLGTLWGNVPLVLKTSLPTDVPANATQADVYAQVEKDLTEAVADLPISYDNSNIGRATRGAAYALLGKTYLQEHKNQQAIDALKWLVEGDGKNVYDLMPNYRDNFVITSENNKESIFEFQFAVNPTDNHDDDTDPRTDNLNYGTSLPPFFAPKPIGFTDGEARRWVVQEYKERTTTGARDPRLAASFLYDSTDERGPDFTLLYGTTFTKRQAQDGTPNKVWFRKMLNDFTDNGESFHSGNNYRFLRFADALMMYAEALNATGQTAAAYAHVDRVRQRAGLAKLSVTMPGLNQAQFLTQLKHERITEFSGEGHRWDDLARWGDLGPQLSGRDAGFANFVKGKHELLPIPQQDIDINPNLKQNAGY